MTHLNKRTLTEKDLLELTKRFDTVIAALDNKSAASFMTDLLGKEERIMLMKRFAAIVMISKGYSSYRVWKTLAISPSTAHRISNNVERGHYDRLLTSTQSCKDDYGSFWNTLATIIDGSFYLATKAPWDAFRNNTRPRR